MLNIREFVGEEHYKFCRSEYDNARYFLKNCGIPKDKYDIFLIKEAKKTTEVFKKYVNSSF